MCFYQQIKIKTFHKIAHLHNPVFWRASYIFFETPFDRNLLLFLTLKHIKAFFNFMKLRYSGRMDTGDRNRKKKDKAIAGKYTPRQWAPNGNPMSETKR